MQNFEKDYAGMLREILSSGHTRETRNGSVLGVFGRSLTVPVGNIFPIIQGRQMFVKGILGEFTALLNRPTCVEDFEKWGCNYWKLWADKDGKLIVDYGNAWFDFNGFNQVKALKEALRDNPTDRRMIISSWRPDRLAKLSLPCCHYSYQFYVRDGKHLDMVWTQRSADMMVGLPSDIVLAATWLITLANEFHLWPGTIKLDLGDCHIYKEHLEMAEEYCRLVATNSYQPVYFSLDMRGGTDFCTFEPQMLKLCAYPHGPRLDLLLKE